jgi:hypothetical protein
MIITEFPPNLPIAEFSGGRVHSISIHPSKPDHIIVANQFCGLWKTEDGGSTWFHLDGLLSIFVRDVAYAPDGNTVIATLARDNQVKNGGGIWVSSDGGKGKSWYRASSGDPHNHSKLPNKSRIPSRISAYGISYSPDDAKKVYVGTDYGVAISTDNGDTWNHKMLENTSAVFSDYWFWEPKKQNSVPSILALPNNKAIALSHTGVYFTDEKFREGKRWTWNRIKKGSFIFEAGLSCKNIDVSPLDSDKVFILQDYSNLLLYEIATNKWTTIPLSLDTLGRSPFVRVSRSSASSSSIDIWLGLGRLYKATCKDMAAAKALKSKDWFNIGGPEGVHDDTGYLGLDNRKLPILYGSDGGLFKPKNPEATKWTGISGKSGLNSLQIVDAAGTNVRSPKHTCLYFGTQDNSVWASGDDGHTWPNRDGGEGYFIQVMKDAKSDSEVKVGYCALDPRFSEAHLVNPKNVPDDNIAGGKLSDPHSSFFISPRKWIRLNNFRLEKFDTFTPEIYVPEIYVSQDNGEKWWKIANVDLACYGVFAISKWAPLGPIDPFEDSKPGSRDPVIYIPFRGEKTRPDGGEIVGLIKFTDVFRSTVKNYGEMDLIYLNDNGSLGRRFTEFDWQAVFGVDPKNPHFIIAPDIYNNRVMVSRDSGLHWNIDKNLTREVTKNKTLLLYDEHPIRMQVTRISFDPYHREHIYVGTRDAGIILSTDGGSTWSTIPGTNRILYITSFFFKPHSDTIIVSTYGRGLWKIYTKIFILTFPVKSYCPKGGSPCNFWLPVIPKQIKSDTIDWHDKDVTVFLNGRINGLILSGAKIMKISVSPGTNFKRYLGKIKDFHELNIVESEQGEGFDGLKGCLAAIDNGEIIEGIVLKENEIFGIISGKEEFKEEKNKVDQVDFIGPKEEDLKEGKNDPDYKSKGKDKSIVSKKPYLFISTSIPIMGTSVVGSDGIIKLFAKGFKFVPKRNNDVKIMIDSEVIDKSAKVTQGGNVRSQLKVSKELSYGHHIVKIVQKVNRKSITASERFVKAVIDEIDKNMKTKVI